MITRIEVDGFKSLRGFSLEFEPLTAVIGANGAGKSNLFDVFRLLSLLPRMSVTDAFRSLRGHIRDQFSQTKDGPGESMTITVELLLDAQKLRYETSNRWRYSIRIDRINAYPTMTEALEVTTESLTHIRSSEDTWIMHRPALQALILDDDSKRTLQKPAIPNHPNPATRQGSFLASNMSGTVDIADELASIRLLHPDPGKLRLPSERGAGAMLLPDGSNLPTAIAATTPEIRAQIRADLAELVPGFRSFEIVPNDDELRLDVEFSDGTRTPARVLSDGTLRLFALLTLLRTQQSRGMIAIEEPENGIYPGRLRALIKKLEEATSPLTGQMPPQIILNSHSPSLVAALHHRPECLVFADLIRQRDGLRSTRMRHARVEETGARDHSTVSPNEIEHYLESARPDEEA